MKSFNDILNNLTDNKNVRVICKEDFIFSYTNYEPNKILVSDYSSGKNESTLQDTDYIFPQLINENDWGFLMETTYWGRILKRYAISKNQKIIITY